MTTDPLDTALQRSGAEPTAAFTSGLESVLLRAYDGEPIATPSSLAADRPTRRWIAAVAAAAVIAAAVVTAVVVRNDDGDNVATTPEPGTTSPPITQPSPSTSIGPTPTTIGETTLPGTTQPPTTTSTSTTTSTTIASVVPIQVTIDLTTAATPLQPTVIASFPIAPPGDLFPTAYATPAGDDRIAVIDGVTGVVRFVDAATGAELSSYPTPIPTIGSNSYAIGNAFVGPDDVIYVNVGNAEGGGNTPNLIAYARSGNDYVEVARQPHGIGDSYLTLGLTATGISMIGTATTPLMPYVDVTGRPSGVVLDIDDIAIGPDADTFRRGDLAWHVDFPAADWCSPCTVVAYGPNDSLVLIGPSPRPDGDVGLRVTVLSDTVVSYDTQWTYVGVLGDSMLFTHLDQDSIDIGTVPV